MNLSCVNRSSRPSLLWVSSSCFSPALSLSLFLSCHSFSFCAPEVAFRCSPWKSRREPTLRVISQQNLSIAGVTYSSRHYYSTTGTTTITIIRGCRRSDSRDPFLIFPVLDVVFPFASRPASFSSSSSSCFCSSSYPSRYLYGLGLLSPRALVGESKFNGDRRVKPSIFRPFLSI